MTRNEVCDPDIKRALEWFLSFLRPEEWQKRKEAIEDYLESVLAPHDLAVKLQSQEPVSVSDDRMGWYLYLAETALYEPHKYEPLQGARVLPIFKRLGADFDLLARIVGTNEKATKLLLSDRQQPDSGLFEMLVALLWARNGWPSIEFIPESPPYKSPDIKVASTKEEWFIECKRLSAKASYSQKERQKWLSMWRYLTDYLKENRLSFILDITFHVELSVLPDEFIRDELCGKLQFIVPPCTVISNDMWEVSVKQVDYEKAHSHLRQYHVKYPSDQLIKLVSGKRDPNRGFTCIVKGQIERIGGGRGNN